MFTKRERIVSICLVAMMLVAGLLISSTIHNKLLDKYNEYDTALQIVNDTDLFIYGMHTDVGNAFVYGTVKTIDPVTFEELDGWYATVRKVKERYTQHSRTVTYTTRDANGHTTTHSRVEHYWTWDAVDSWEKHATYLTFLGVKFRYDQIDLPTPHYLSTVRDSSVVRYVFYGTSTTHVGTIYAKLLHDDIQNARFYAGKDITQTIQWLESYVPLIIFWIVWVAAIIGGVVLFARLDNRWLEDQRKRNK